MDHAEHGARSPRSSTSSRRCPRPLPVRRELEHSAWVTIQVGCNNTCTFCIVPRCAGVGVSRRPGDIMREVESLASDGVVEVTLLGQNVDTYGRDLAIDGRRRPIFGDLLRKVGAVDGIRRVRFTSPHPNDFREDVALAMAETEAVCEQLHFPSSPAPIASCGMHRGYTGRSTWTVSTWRASSSPVWQCHRHHRRVPRGDRRDFELTMEVVRRPDSTKPSCSSSRLALALALPT
jgi:tRNA-2-methylthio-N6-dimethylallyladenosine synthase